MRFTKMHGIGNDYVVVNCFDQQVERPEELARRMLPRRFSVGADGLILVMPSSVADLRMRIFNPDGSEAEMCGNGIRCAARYAYEHGVCTKGTMTVETKAGLREITLRVEGEAAVGATVNMGRPALTRAEIPMFGEADRDVIDQPIVVGDRRLRMTCLSMGNPHCVIPVGSIEETPWRELGPAIETHELFPNRTNVNFVELISRNEVRMVTWERGAGATLACGTGASAVCVAMHLLGRTERAILAHLPGGDLELEWREDGDVYMTGPAEEVYDGVWE